jgi:hypothetical protein
LFKEPQVFENPHLVVTVSRSQSNAAGHDQNEAGEQYSENTASAEEFLQPVETRQAERPEDLTAAPAAVNGFCTRNGMRYPVLPRPTHKTGFDLVKPDSGPISSSVGRDREASLVYPRSSMLP